MRKLCKKAPVVNEIVGRGVRCGPHVRNGLTGNRFCWTLKAGQVSLGKEEGGGHCRPGQWPARRVEVERSCWKGLLLQGSGG